MLGPPDGRHVVREAGDPPSDIVVVVTLGAPERRRLARRRGRSLPGDSVPEPTPVTTSRVTVIDATRPFDEEAAADAWLSAAGAEEVERALAVLDRVVRAHRIARNDPSIRVPHREDAIAVRLGFGTGEQAAEGRLGSARELGALTARKTGPGRRASALRPQEHAASVLASRAPALACEELTEPFLFLGMCEGAADRFAAAIAGEVPAARLEAASAALERLEAALRARAARL